MRLIAFFLLISAVCFSQSDERIGTLSVTTSSGTAPNWTVGGVYGSATGFSGSDVQVGDKVVVRYVLGVTHSRNIYNITAINSAGATNLNVDLTRVEGTAVTGFPAGTHAVTNTLNNLLYDVPNISQQLESYIINYDLKSLDSSDVASTTLRNDSLFVVTNGGTEIYSGSEAGVSGGLLADTCYAVTITSGNVGSVLWVCATGTGVTASFSGNKLTMTSTTTSMLKTANWIMAAADVQAAADAGGVSNTVQVEFAATLGNTGLTDMRVPTVAKTAIPGTGALSVLNPASIDIDNNPSVSVIGVSGNAIIIRVGGLIVGAQGYELTFTGVH